MNERNIKSVDSENSQDFEAVIGLEVHVQLSTVSKIFSSSSAEYGHAPNTQVDEITLGLPGSLPIINKKVVDFAIKLGLATSCNIRKESVFARKHYFYPDLPKGYQISQYDKPICENGYILINVASEARRIGITRIHLEEDAGKNIHSERDNSSYVDLNRAGVPLLEIVSEPDLRTPVEAGEYMRKIRQIVRFLGVCDGNMEQGSLRCDANVSVRKKGSLQLGTKVEVKNLNSFRFVEKALEFEIGRQINLIEDGGKIRQETRLWSEVGSETRPMRSKETAEDYRYFPDPDLLPLIVGDSWIENIRNSMPELPCAIRERYISIYGLSDYLAEILSEEKAISDYFDLAVKLYYKPKSIANWITSELFGRLNKDAISICNCPVTPTHLAELVKMVDENTISGKMAKLVFEEMFTSNKSPELIVRERGLVQISDPNLIMSLVLSILNEHKSKVSDYNSGKTKLFGFFVGQVMKETNGTADPVLLDEVLKRELDKMK